MRRDYIQVIIFYGDVQCIFRQILILFLTIWRVLQHLKEIHHPQRQTVRKSRFSQGLAGVGEVLPAVEHGVGQGARRGRGIGRGRAQNNQPPEYQWRNVDFSDYFEDDWLETPRQRGILIDTSDYKPVDFFKYFFPVDTMTTQF